jgi:hypothetical protein
VSTENQKRILALLLGLVTIGAAAFTWRAGQIASGAAFDDRQAVSQTIKQEQQNLELALTATNQAVGYVRYVADYGEAAALDAEAAAFASAGQDSFSAIRQQEADDLRRAATTRAAAQGIFGQSSISDDVLSPAKQPRDFDLVTQYQLLQQEAETNINSPGVLDPDAFAMDADDKRDQVRGLKVAALVMILGVAALTAAQVARNRTRRLAWGALGTVIAVITTIVTFNTVWS